MVETRTRAQKALQLFMPVSSRACLPDSHSHQMKTPCRGYIIILHCPPCVRRIAPHHRFHLRL
jgi:hypothetical protein